MDFSFSLREKIQCHNFSLGLCGGSPRVSAVGCHDDTWELTKRLLKNWVKCDTIISEGDYKN